ncbi:MAG: hypothetical protein N3B13_07295 [Deltaproteobacteria bacterium]|nr:hypothetical protein [Deltaproteobacteria bacterium]
MSEYITLPDKIRVGTTYIWNEYIPDYPSGIYSAKYVINSLSNRVEILGIANTDEITYNFTIRIDTLAGLSIGDNYYILYVEKINNGVVAERYEIKSGVVKILPDLSKNAVDVRSHYKKVLDALESVIENKATADQLSMSIAGVSISRMSADDIIRWYHFYRAKYEEEINKYKLENGSIVSNQIKVIL